ncbi:MAG: MogA/MoaB family molybdenum cofactor biosynthesis protein [Lachnospiraceae bacterium]|jgi:molybdenum cofactor synthesis domain-containing protein|nr:MogA/MoaB family molybdenum cofactor biosynthesis protein [Lachnospiraceae bacterium]
MDKFTVGIVTLSDKGSAGQRVDESGPAIAAMLPGEVFEVVSARILPDGKETLMEELKRLSDEVHCDLVLTTGGTGFSPRDLTPEATLAVADRLAPGIAEAMRLKSLEITDRAMLSRAASVIRGSTLIVNLPGSPKSVRENLSFILGALPHGLEILRGDGGECAAPETKG